MISEEARREARNVIGLTDAEIDALDSFNTTLDGKLAFEQAVEMLRTNDDFVVTLRGVYSAFDKMGRYSARRLDFASMYDLAIGLSKLDYLSQVSGIFLGKVE